MTITHRIDDFLFELFPGTESDTEKADSINTLSQSVRQRLQKQLAVEEEPG